MPDETYGVVAARYWRMLAVRWHRVPFESGSHLIGGRFNRLGLQALYLSDDHTTAIAEHHQLFPRPGTLVGYDVASERVVNLTDVEMQAVNRISAEQLACPWFDLMRRGETPPTWTLADRLVAEGAHGALVPSFQRRGGTNLVLWRWHAADTDGEGAAITLIDPTGELARSTS